MKFVLFFFLTLSSVFVFAGRDDGFPLEPAPINQKIEGTWVSYDSGLEAPIIFQFCHISKRSIRLSQGASSEIAKNKIYNSKLQTTKTTIKSVQS